MTNLAPLLVFLALLFGAYEVAVALAALLWFTRSRS